MSAGEPQPLAGSARLAAPEWRHWHPILCARELGRRPRSVALLGVDLVVFRSGPGPDDVAALVDECPHRRMRLSQGRVDGGCVVCPYHGFRFAADGRGTSPGTPQLHLDAIALEVRVAWEVIWVRRPGATTAFPELGRPLHGEGERHFAGVLAHTIEGPLEPTIDNFCEVEHTPTTHALLGYREDAVGDIRVAVTTTPDSVRVVNEGRQKPLPRLVEWAFGIRSDDVFVDDWTVRFSPVHIHYDQSWREPTSGVARPDSVHPVVFFVPVEHDVTRLFTFLWTSRSRGALDVVLRPLVRRLVDHEVRLDRAMIERLADPDPDLRGTRLGRFDAALREHRKRIATIYRA
ncbi:MAG: Rieske 2Fe-2S domain-containing protein [Deltaproteobacteria bacterium]|nr:Rieske 2Fe-2S domain-containing protein [Deltaproteobacteria bacterium]